MRRGRALAVSSALLFLSITSASHHVDSASDVRLFEGPSHLLIVEFYPRGLLSDEYFGIGNPSASPKNLLGWAVTDGEGILRFVEDRWIPPYGVLYASFNSSSFERAYGQPPEICLDMSSSGVVRTGTFRLADTGDTLELLDPGLLQVDCIAYGSTASPAGWSGIPVPSLRQGEVARRLSLEDEWVDNDRASDWMPFREYKYGYTDFEPRVFDIAPGALKAFASPDCSLEVVHDSLQCAERSIRLCSYQLSSSSVCSELLSARARGVNVQILVDGEPAGGIEPREIECLSALVTGGIDVREICGNLSYKVVQHFGPMHAKYAVVDSYLSIIMSENFVESGLPVDKILGNRGWGLAIESSDLALELTRLFDDDSRTSRMDVKSWLDDPRFSNGAQPPSAPWANHTTGALRPLTTQNASSLRLVISPDGSVIAPFLEGIMSRASSLLIQQFQVSLMWEDRWRPSPQVNPLLRSTLSSMRSGAEARMLFDSSWFNAEGNKPALNYMASAVKNESLNGQFRLMDPRNPISVAHNKGAIIDGIRTVVSSNNWGYSSFSKNREVAAIVDSSEVAAYFQRAFEMDWSPDDSPPIAEAGPSIVAQRGDVVLLSSTGSVDDRVIAHASWDLEEDGLFETSGPNVTFYCIDPGTHRIVLRVEDGWGNSATDEVFVTVARDQDDEGIGSAGLIRSLLLALGALSGGVFGAMLARHRNARRVRLINGKKVPPDR